MSCLTAGISKKCKRKVSGGLSTIHIADFQTVDSWTAGVDNAISAVTMVDPLTDFFYKFQYKVDSASFTETFAKAEGSGINTVEIVMSITALSQADINVLNDLKDCGCGLSIIVMEKVKDELGVAEGKVFGELETEEVFLTGVVNTSGAAVGDANEAVVTFTATMSDIAPKWTGGVAGIPVA